MLTVTVVVFRFTVVEVSSSESQYSHWLNMIRLSVSTVYILLCNLDRLSFSVKIMRFVWFTDRLDILLVLRFVWVTDRLDILLVLSDGYYGESLGSNLTLNKLCHLYRDVKNNSWVQDCCIKLTLKFSCVINYLPYRLRIIKHFVSSLVRLNPVNIQLLKLKWNSFTVVSIFLETVK